MLSTTSQYALRALTKLASQPPSQPMLGRDLAAQADIPANYLSKILLSLRNAGILATARGSGGGYRLERKPGEIRLIEVVEVFDAPKAKPDCLLGEGECSDDDACSAHHAWKQIRQNYINFLETTTLAEISRRPGVAIESLAATAAPQRMWGSQP
jgi:Rrf2 family iron-sulfur cluster assembly transcriptional regulator